MFRRAPTGGSTRTYDRSHSFAPRLSGPSRTRHHPTLFRTSRGTSQITMWTKVARFLVTWTVCRSERAVLVITKSQNDNKVTVDGFLSWFCHQEYLVCRVFVFCPPILFWFFKRLFQGHLGSALPYLRSCPILQ